MGGPIGRAAPKSFGVGRGFESLPTQLPPEKGFSRMKDQGSTLEPQAFLQSRNRFSPNTCAARAFFSRREPEVAIFPMFCAFCIQSFIGSSHAWWLSSRDSNCSCKACFAAKYSAFSEANVWRSINCSKYASNSRFDLRPISASSVCSEKQAELILSMVAPGGRVWIAPDGDKAGERHAQALLALISPHRFVRWVKLADGIQPTELSAEKLKTRFTL